MKRSLGCAASCLAVGVLVLGGWQAAIAQPPPAVRAGANMNIDFNEEIDVPFSGFVGQWFVSENLIHDPGAGPFIKRLESPITDTLDPILLDAQQPLPIRVDEDFNLVSPTLAVSDWHEEILTPGFVWVIPDDTAFPGVFPAGTSLITRNGDPHPFDFVPGPAVANRIDVVFPPILPGETLDIHKAILWVGTDGNRIWGDNLLDDGTAFDESTIRVWEFPTPEPSGLTLLLAGLIAAPNGRRRG